MTGYADDELPPELRFAAKLTKPLSLETLSATLEGLQPPEIPAGH